MFGNSRDQLDRLLTDSSPTATAKIVDMAFGNSRSAEAAVDALKTRDASAVVDYVMDRVDAKKDSERKLFIAMDVLGGLNTWGSVSAISKIVCDNPVSGSRVNRLADKALDVLSEVLERNPDNEAMCIGNAIERVGVSCRDVARKAIGILASAGDKYANNIVELATTYHGNAGFAVDALSRIDADNSSYTIAKIARRSPETRDEAIRILASREGEFPSRALATMATPDTKTRILEVLADRKDEGVTRAVTSVIQNTSSYVGDRIRDVLGLSEKFSDKCLAHVTDMVIKPDALKTYAAGAQGKDGENLRESLARAAEANPRVSVRKIADMLNAVAPSGGGNPALVVQ